MLGHLDVDAGDDSWSLMLGDREVASGGRYDRVSFTLTQGFVSSVTTENVIDLMGTHSASPFPLATFEGLVTSEKLQELTHDPALLEAETAYFNTLLSHKTALADALKGLSVSSSSSPAASTFQSSVAAHPLDFAGFFIGSVMVGMLTVLGVTRFLSPSSKTTASYDAVLDHSSSFQGAGATVGIELEKPMKKFSSDLNL
jgi:hypothetical protein